MVSIGIQRNSDGQVIGCHLSGHAGYDVHGFDIVCAAVSALTATVNQSGQDILGTMLLGLEEISRQYPEFVQIHEI